MSKKVNRTGRRYKKDGTGIREKRPAKPLQHNSQILDIQDYLKDKNERDYILFIIGITTGYRAGDLVKLKVRDIKEAIKREEFIIYENKKVNMKIAKELTKEVYVEPRVVELVAKVSKILKEYIKDKKDYEFMFPSRKGHNKPITVATISRILKEAGEYFELQDISAHTMRKTYALEMYKITDKNIYEVKELLGHSSIEVTKLYIGLGKIKISEYNKKLNRMIR